MFVGLARDRFDSLISSPSATFAAHARTLALLLVIFANDVACIMVFMSNHGKAPIGHLTLWLFDTVVAGLEAAAIMIKYGEALLLMLETTRQESTIFMEMKCSLGISNLLE